MRILPTGGTGHIGSHTAIALIEAGHQVTLLDSFCNSRPAVLDRHQEITGETMDFFEVDVTDEDALERTELEADLARLQKEVGDEPNAGWTDGPIS